MKPASPLLTMLVAGTVLAPAHAQQGGMTRARAVEEATIRFAALDVDKDGIVTLAEVTAAAAKRAEETGRPLSPERAQRQFAGMDVDKDGKVALAEAVAAARTRFDGSDANKNGVIDPSEEHARPRGSM
ncbi:hypothetical protein BH10PSE13_BH10PSE13_23120 [soil metagenome]